MDRGAWWAPIREVAKTMDMTMQLTHTCLEYVSPDRIWK